MKSSIIVRKVFTSSSPKANKVVCHIVALPFTLKSILRQKEEEFIETQILFHHAKIIKSSKKSSTRNQNPSRY